MKSILMLLVLLTPNQQCNKNGELNFLKATSQSWSGGAAGMRGTYYTIYLDMIISEDYKFDSLWTNGKRLPVEIRRANSADTLTLFANDRMGVRMPGSDVDPSKSVEAKFPVKINAEGVLGYFYKGARRYFPITVFEKLKPLAYP
jgi:hypothetical protein